MTQLSVEQQVLKTLSDLQGSVAELQGDVKEMKSALFGSEITKGAIPELRKILEDHERQLDRHEKELVSLKTGRKIEQAEQGIRFTVKQKVVALLMAAPAFFYYLVNLAKALHLFQ